MLDPALERIPNVWRAQSLRVAGSGVITTGHHELDVALGGGWPAPALIEVLYDREGMGELQLLRSLMQPRSRSESHLEQRCAVLWLNTPFEPQAVAIAQLGLDPGWHWHARSVSPHDALWAMEHALRSGSCALVMAWAQQITLAMLRRLKLAAVAHGSIGVLFRPTAAAAVPSPATLRMRLQPRGEELRIELLKVQGRKPACLNLPLQGRTRRTLAVQRS
jgi:hypothetical protein